ncbi:GNAT family N-acetyltransferase [Sphingobacterium deserti]|uniref:N-acetyltransferase domain-containing protein n=1 Tax=Sphingobacterium deserti TaxID=1229276 RepID=A0A0B8SZY4_9SPHI|nr:GNAT family N-acetyltransferase [Sphingobacterium deserti]KGE13321.1 hypothetical protein DI53_2852 [Sphingobacterium deserti]
MEKNIIIRPYQSTDKATLLELLRLLVPTYFAEEEIADLSEYLDNEVERYFVAEEQGKLVAAAGINFEKEHGIGKLSWDFVHPDKHGRGLGKMLLNYRIDLIIKMPQVQEITVRTSQLAYRFYEKHGFKVVDIQKDYWAPGFDMYKMLYERQHP